MRAKISGFGVTRKEIQKYLSLVHPMTNGHRKREYIGRDQSRIKEALERYRQYQGLTGELKRLAFKTE